MNKRITQKEFEDLCKAWKQARFDHSSNKTFFMLVQWVPIGSNGGKIVCRQVSSPHKNNVNHDNN